MNYQAYHHHSYYSNIITPDSPVSPEDYAKRAVELGQSVLSSVEHGWAGRYVEYHDLAKKYGLKFVFGLEAYFVRDRLVKDNTNAHLILLAKTEAGRRAINRILSEANRTGFYYRARVDLPLLLSLPSAEVWVTTACVAGIWKYEDYDPLVAILHEHFGNHFFLEVQNHNTDSQKALNQKIIDLSNHYGIKTIFGTDSHFIVPEQDILRGDYLASKHITYEDEDGWLMDYPSCDEAVERFLRQGVLTRPQIATAMENTHILLDVQPYESRVFEKEFKIPSPYPEKSLEEKNQIFKEIVWGEWANEKPFVSPKKISLYEEEINKELDIILATGMADYFLLDREIVRRGKELGGQITMTGRGSAPSFFISKLLGLTTIDRISATVKLFPERFITKERILEARTLPDIDLNLGNPEIFAKAQTEILGEDHSYPMMAFGTMRPKAAWKMYARAKNVEFEVANLISEQIDKYERELAFSGEEDADSVDISDYIEPQYQKMYEESKVYLGIIADAKIHPCSYLLYDGNICEEIGLIQIKDHLCACIDGKWAEDYKFLKNDLLKVSVVNLIYRVFERIGMKIIPFSELLKLCEKDEEVWKIYQNAWGMGVNQIEQHGTLGRVCKYAPRNISELSAFIAAIRPGFKSNYKQFEKREEFSYGIPSLDKLIQTKEFPYSYMLYQENAMQVMAYAGIPISETYEVVKNIAKKRPEKVFKYKEQFMKGMVEKIQQAEHKTVEESQEIADMTWQVIEDSSRYQFNASHSYAYAGDSLYCAYLKSHYPLEFYETFLRILEEDGDKDRLALTKQEASEAYHIKFPPLAFGQDNRNIVADPQTHSITSSITSIKGFGKEMGQNLFELSQNKYENFLEFLTICEDCGKISKKFIELIKINYFACFGKNRKLLEFFQEFTAGKSRYCKSHKDKTKQERLLALQAIWDSIPDDSIDILSQIYMEQECLGYLSTVYPHLNKRFVYVMELDMRFSPRLQVYCLANGAQNSLKMRKGIYDATPFNAGEIIYINVFTKRNSVKYENGKYVDIEDEYTWWIDDFKVVTPDLFDKMSAK